MLMLVVLLLLALCAAETRPRDTIFINGERRWARRSSGGEFRDIIDPGRASREDQKLTHLRGSDRGGWVPEWAPRWSKELVTKAYRKYHGLRARVRNAQKRSFDENVDFFGRKVEKIF